MQPSQADPREDEGRSRPPHVRSGRASRQEEGRRIAPALAAERASEPSPRGRSLRTISERLARRTGDARLAMAEQ